MANNRKTKQISKTTIVIALIGGVLILGAIAFLVIRQNRTSSESSENVQVKLGTYKGVSVDVTPTKEDIDTEEETCAEEHLSAKKGITLKKGDYISVDFVGRINGKKFEGSTAKGQTMTLGDYEYVQDLEDGLVGKKTGQTVEIPVTFPADYDDDLAGKKAVFTVTINEVQVKYSDELLQETTKGKYKTKAEYRAVLGEQVKKDNIDSIPETAWEQVISSTEVKKLNDKLKSEALSDTEAEYKNFAEVSDVKYEELLAQWGMSEDDVKELANDKAKEWVVADAIIKDAKLSFDDATYLKYLRKEMTTDVDKEQKEEYEKMNLKQLVKEYEKNTSLSPSWDMKVEFVKDYVAKNAVIKK